MEPGLSVVIPNYNGAALFPYTLPTVFEALHRSGNTFEVIIADDCSTDDSITHLQKFFPEVRIIRNEKNSGFSITANRGIKAAVYDLVLLLNSDVKLEPEYFQCQCRYFENDQTFGVMGRIVGWDNDRIQDGAKFPSFHNVKIKTSLNYILSDAEEMKDGLFSMYLSGANAFLNRKKFLLLGGFNELFSPFYVEDYELSLRAWRMGWKCYYEHSAVCRHDSSVTIKSKDRQLYIKMIYNRNKMFLHALHLPQGTRILWFIQLIPEIIIQTLLLKHYYPKAFWEFIKNYRKVKESRRKLKEIAGNRKLSSVKEIARFIQASVKNKKAYFFRSGAF